MEQLSSKDKTLSPGFTSKLKGRFRSLCTNAGAGTTLTNLVPTDSYCSVLCGGLKIVFKAIEETGEYREEVYNALEEIPFILGDNFLSWLTLDESSFLFLDTRSDDQTGSLEMLIVTAEIFRDILTFSGKQASTNKQASTSSIFLAFFCSQHKYYAGDLDAHPTELVMSILLQLPDQYRDFDP